MCTYVNTPVMYSKENLQHIFHRAFALSQVAWYGALLIAGVHPMMARSVVPQIEYSCVFGWLAAAPWLLQSSPPKRLAHRCHCLPVPAGPQVSYLGLAALLLATFVLGAAVGRRS